MIAASLRAITFKSTAGNNKRLLLNASLTKRLTLFRVTAQPIFLLTVTPRRACARLFSCHTIKIPLEANLWTEHLRLRNSDLFFSLAAGGYVFLTGVVSATKELFGGNANRQVFSTFCSSALDDQAAVFGGHPYQKAVSSFTRNVTWLKCSFHVSNLW
jgi:hypothetical protein